MDEIKKGFEAATEEVQSLNKRPDNDTMLKLYALYKQATKGDVSGKRPGMFDMIGRAKYDAWSAIKGVPEEEAMLQYINLVEELKRTD